MPETWLLVLGTLFRAAPFPKGQVGRLWWGSECAVAGRRFARRGSVADGAVVRWRRGAATQKRPSGVAAFSEPLLVWGLRERGPAPFAPRLQHHSRNAEAGPNQGQQDVIHLEGHLVARTVTTGDQ
uniref:Uncharacterized protein n=1 Tax=Ixodes ricinus TaxID=34613 RepID=A0A6B0UQE7_IXORI